MSVWKIKWHDDTLLGQQEWSNMFMYLKKLGPYLENKFKKATDNI